MKWIFAIAAVLMIPTSTLAQTPESSATLRKEIVSPGVEKVSISPTPPDHYVGLGPRRTMQLLTFPGRHPMLFFHKTTFPVRHPLVAYQKFGKIMEPYQPALNATSALCGPATTAGVYTLHGVR